MHLVCGNATCPSSEHESASQVINQSGSLAPIKMIKQIAGQKVKCEHRVCAWEVSEPRGRAQIAAHAWCDMLHSSVSFSLFCVCVCI